MAISTTFSLRLYIQQTQFDCLAILIIEKVYIILLSSWEQKNKKYLLGEEGRGRREEASHHHFYQQQQASRIGTGRTVDPRPCLRWWTRQGESDRRVGAGWPAESWVCRSRSAGSRWRTDAARLSRLLLLHCSAIPSCAHYRSPPFRPIQLSITMTCFHSKLSPLLLVSYLLSQMMWQGYNIKLKTNLEKSKYPTNKLSYWNRNHQFTHITTNFHVLLLST